MMILYKIHQGILVKAAEGYYLVNDHNWDDLVNRPDLYAAICNLLTRSISNGEANDILENDLLPPIGNQEIWAAGVTYLRSKVARMEEAKGSGGGNFYDRVYDADRPAGTGADPAGKLCRQNCRLYHWQRYEQPRY